MTKASSLYPHPIIFTWILSIIHLTCKIIRAPFHTFSLTPILNQYLDYTFSCGSINYTSGPFKFLCPPFTHSSLTLYSHSFFSYYQGIKMIVLLQILRLLGSLVLDSYTSWALTSHSPSLN